MKYHKNNNNPVKISTQQYIPFPFRRPGPKQFVTQQILPDINLRLFNFASKSVPQGQQINWDKIQSIAISDSVNSGLIFVETDRGSIAIKGIDDIPVHTFLNQLAEVLQINVPSQYTVRWDSQEYKILTKELQRATFIHQELHERVRARLDRPFIAIQQYIPNITISEMGPMRSQKVLAYYDPISRNRMIKLGLVYGLDLLINNKQRLPLYTWELNDAGLEHIILHSLTSHLDTTNELKDPNNLDIQYDMFYSVDYRFDFLEESNNAIEQNMMGRYYVRLEEFLNLFFMEMKSVMHAQLDPMYETKEQKLDMLSDLKNMIYRMTQYEIKEMTILQIMIGVVLGINNLVEMGYNNIELLLKAQSLDESKDYKNYWNQNLKKVKLSFIESVLSIFKKTISINNDVLKWAQDITLNQYTYDKKLLDQYLKTNIQVKTILENQEQQQFQLGTQQLMQIPIQSNSDQIFNDDEILEIDEGTQVLDKKIKDIFDIDFAQIKADQDAKQKAEELLKMQEEEKQAKLKYEQEQQLLIQQQQQQQQLQQESQKSKSKSKQKKGEVKNEDQQQQDKKKSWWDF